jgi:hypothetical protein
MRNIGFKLFFSIKTKMVKPNLYEPPTIGFRIYHVRKCGTQRWSATRKYPNGKTRSALVYSVEEARAFLDALPDEYTPNPNATYDTHPAVHLSQNRTQMTIPVPS